MGATFTVVCPECEQIVNRVDGEYERHKARGELCLMSKREIIDVGSNGR